MLASGSKGVKLGARSEDDRASLHVRLAICRRNGARIGVAARARKMSSGCPFLTANELQTGGTRKEA